MRWPPVTSHALRLAARRRWAAVCAGAAVGCWALAAVVGPLDASIIPVAAGALLLLMAGELWTE